MYDSAPVYRSVGSRWCTFMELAEEHIDVSAVAGHAVQPLGREPLALDELDTLLHEQRHAVRALADKRNGHMEACILERPFCGDTFPCHLCVNAE